jgi:hypothetical protein
MRRKARPHARPGLFLLRTRSPVRYSLRMSAAPASPAPPRHRIVAPVILALFGVIGMSAIWALLALILDRQCAWMAVLAALDIALLLRLGRAAPGLPRAFGTLAATFATIVFGNWIIAATQVGGPMGFRTLDALQRLGTDHAQTLFGLANQPAEWAWYAAAAIVALWAGR